MGVAAAVTTVVRKVATVERKEVTTMAKVAVARKEATTAARKEVTTTGKVAAARRVVTTAVRKEATTMAKEATNKRRRRLTTTIVGGIYLPGFCMFPSLVCSYSVFLGIYDFNSHVK